MPGLTVRGVRHMYHPCQPLGLSASQLKLNKSCPALPSDFAMPCLSPSSLCFIFTNLAFIIFLRAAFMTSPLLTSVFYSYFNCCCICKWVLSELQCKFPACTSGRELESWRGSASSFCHVKGLCQEHIPGHLIHFLRLSFLLWILFG